MEIVCLDLEGVLVPEIWIAFAEETGIPELKRTTRDEPDYDKLMKYRLNILKEHGLGLKEIQETISKIDPIPGAKEFLDKLRELTQVIIISDTFSQFAGPLMKKLGYPTIFCNSLVVADNGEITDFKMRCEKSKYTTVKALQSIGYDTIASGDSHNDLGMIQASKAGFLFKSTDAIKAEYPKIPAYETYDELYDAIKKVSDAYTPSFCISSLCDPFSTICPCSITTMSSALLTVESLWAMMIVVLPTASFSNVSWIFASVTLSSAEVASSRIRIGGFFRKIRAIEILCFCPPERSAPLSPTFVSNPFGISIISS